MTEELKKKYDTLNAYLTELGSVAVAFSGGVDSTFLMKAAADLLGDKAIAVTAVSEFFPERERLESEDFCSREGIRQIRVRCEELAIEGLAHNPKNRCYLCKKELFTKILDAAHTNGASYVAEGSNTDDTGDYRPGLQAIAELGIQSPLRRVGLSKQDIRDLSRELGLPTYNKPSFACLASRFAYGETITASKLHMVEAAEQLLLDCGLTQERVRIHGSSDYIARIEVMPDEFDKVLSSREKITDAFKALGFRYVALDLQGFRSGAMNESLTKEELDSAGQIKEV